ncbi:MAG: hypothetical protein ACR2PY_06925, partial [Salinispira sp.]
VCTTMEEPMNESTQEAMNTSENADYLTIGDILAFFITYRKLILIPTAALSILLFVLLVFTPVLDSLINPSSSNAYVTAISIPESVQDAILMQQTVQQQITTLLNSPSFLLDVHNNFDSEYRQPGAYERNSHAAQHTWAENNLTVTARVDNSEDFLKLLLNKINEKITGELNSLYEEYLARNDNALAQIDQLLHSYFSESQNPETLIGISVFTIVDQRLSIINYFNEGLTSIWDDQILIEEPNANIGAGAGIIFMMSAAATSFILFSILALIVNFFRIIWNDPHEREKIRIALSSAK